MAGTAPGWHPDPAGRWQLRWWDGAAWTDQVATGGRVGTDPLLAGDATAELVNRVLSSALGYADLGEPVADETVTAALWRDAETRREILVLARGHLADLEQQGAEPARGRALTWLTRALDLPPSSSG